MGSDTRRVSARPARRQRALAILATAAVLTLAGCASGEDAHPAVRAVTGVLELRRDDARDPEAYLPYFVSEQVAQSLAAGEGETGTPRVPDWDDVYLSRIDGATAEVAVVWVTDDAFPGWPAVSVFTLREAADGWRVADVAEAEAPPARVE